MSAHPTDDDNEIATESSGSDNTSDPVDPVHDKSGQPRNRARGVLAVLLGIVAILLLMVSTIAVWASATAFDSERFADIVGDALAEPDVQAAMATYVTDQVVAAADVETVLNDSLPAELQRFAPTIAAGARTAIDRGVTRLLANPDVQDIVTELVERAHHRAMQLIEGDGLADGLNVADGEVTLNLLPLISRGLSGVQELGLATELDVPELTADGDPVDQIAQLEAATGRDLPDDFGQLVVYQSDQIDDRQASLQSAQQTFAVAKRAVWVLVGLTIVAIAATVLVSRNRGRAALWLGLGGIVGMIIIGAFVRRVVEEAPNIAADSGGRAAISAILREASTSLLRLVRLLLIAAAVVAGVALLRRRWRREDLVAVGAVLTFVVIVAVLGISIASLLLGLVIALLVPVIARQLFSPTGSDAAGTHLSPGQGEADSP